MFYCQVSLANKAIDNEAGRWDHFVGFSRSICQLRLWANSLVLGKKNEHAELLEIASLGYQTCALTYDTLKFSILWGDLKGQIIFSLIWQRWNFLKLHNTIWVQVLMHHINQWTMIHVLSQILQGHKISISYSSSMNLFHSLIHSLIGQRFSVYWICYSV